MEGLDGSGKSTQADLLAAYLQKQTANFMRIDLPDYNSPSAGPVKLYLNGAFGSDPYDVNPYAASVLFAADRFCSFAGGWKQQYLQGYTILANRYTTSNIVHHTVKLPKTEWDAFFTWISTLEFQKMGLPKPDKIIYLDMDPAISQKLLLNRYAGDASKQDIHEKSQTYLNQCREAALYAAKVLDWTVIRAFENGEPLARKRVFEKIKACFA